MIEGITRCKSLVQNESLNRLVTVPMLRSVPLQKLCRKCISQKMIHIIGAISVLLLERVLASGRVPQSPGAKGAMYECHHDDTSTVL